MVWSLRKLFGREQDAHVAAPEQTRTEIQADLDAADYQEITQKTDRLTSVLEQSGIEYTTRFILPEDAAGPDDYPVIACEIVTFTDPRGVQHMVNVYADRSGQQNGADASHKIMYDRKVAFELASLDEAFIRENPALAADGLRRVGIHENLVDTVPEDRAADTLLTIAKDIPDALPVTLKISIQDPLTKAEARAEMILPSDAAHYLDGAKDPEISITPWNMFKDSVVFSAKPEEHIRDHEGLCPSNPIDGFAFTAPHALHLDYIGNKVEVRIPRAAFGDASAAQLVSHVESTDWKALDDVIAQVRGFKGPDNSPAPQAAL